MHKTENPSSNPSTSEEAANEQASGTTGQTGSLNLNELDEAIIQRVSAARLAVKNLSTVLTRGKTVAEVAGIAEQRTISGWSKRRGYVQKTQSVMARARQMGYELPSHGRDQGVKGRYFASHAEKQAYEVAPNQPIGIYPLPMCENCREYFRYLAQFEQELQVVADIKATRIFYSDARVAVVHSDDRVIVYPSDTKAKKLN